MTYQSFTSESVAAGHPDKICDQISDSILDEAIKIDPQSRVALETMVTKNRVVLAGEVTCLGKLDYAKIARKKIKELGYTDKIYQFTDESPISVYIHEQSPDIARGVDDGGAGDQGMMFGYACNETPELMPLPIILAHRLVEKMDELREKKVLFYLRPDGKSEVKIKYAGGQPKSIEQIILAVPHRPEILKEKLARDLFLKVISPVLKNYGYTVTQDKVIINGTGRWEIGGPASDTGVTGRKIAVDTYGGMGRIGGGCFSGKDPTKVDRSGAYAARFIAKNIVAKNLTDRCEVQLAYVIGYQKPVTYALETFGTEKVKMSKIKKLSLEMLDLSVSGIVNNLKLRQPIYAQSARYGHFGRDIFPWEKIVV